MTDHSPGTVTPTRTIIILGAGGYVGSALCRFFRGLPGNRVVAVSRGQLNHRSFDHHVVADAFAHDWFPQLAEFDEATLINCAFDFQAVGRGDPQTKYATFERNLAGFARSAPTRLINLSTMSAFAGCRTQYGREKLVVEDIFTKLGGVNIRPGLIASWRHPGAAFLNIISIATGSNVVPVLSARDSGFYMCDLEALVLGVYFLAGIKLNKSHTLSFCYRERIKLRDLLRLIEGRNGLRRLKVPVPWRIAYLLLLCKEALIGKSKVRADSVLDFANPVAAPLAREAYARLTEAFRSELEALSPAVSGPCDFSFLERRPAGELAQLCRLKAATSPEVLVALGRLSDA